MKTLEQITEEAPREQKVETIVQAITMIITLIVPLLYFYLPGRKEEIDLWVALVMGVVGAASLIALNYGVAQWANRRKDERVETMKEASWTIREATWREQEFEKAKEG